MQFSEIRGICVSQNTTPTLQPKKSLTNTKICVSHNHKQRDLCEPNNHKPTYT